MAVCGVWELDGESVVDVWEVWDDEDEVVMSIEDLVGVHSDGVYCVPGGGEGWMHSVERSCVLQVA